MGCDREEETASLVGEGSTLGGVLLPGAIFMVEPAGRGGLPVVSNPGYALGQTLLQHRRTRLPL